MRHETYESLPRPSGPYQAPRAYKLRVRTFLTLAVGSRDRLPQEARCKRCRRSTSDVRAFALQPLNLAIFHEHSGHVASLCGIDGSSRQGITMKRFALMVACAASFTLPSVASADHFSPILVAGSDVVEHGGGCRKSSPPGQCCHAGSQPYHCH